MLRYALYCRKSDKDDGDTIKSIEDQRAYWTDRAAQLGLVIAQIYEENMSAMKPDRRPVFRQMMSDLERGRVNAVLVWHVSRIARNVKEGGEFAQFLVDGLIQEVRTPNTCYTPADNILPLLLEQGSAVQQSRDLSRNMKLSQQQMVKAGGWPHLAQIGYLNARDPLNAKRGIIVPDPERFDLVRRGMDMMLTGLYSMSQVIDAMNSWGLRTRPNDHKASLPLSYSRGYALFADPFYAGFIRYQGALYPGKHQAMVSAHEFTRLQGILDRRRLKVRRRKHHFAYVGLLRCGLCGLQVTGEVKKKGARSYIYYHCSNGRKCCTKLSISEPVLEQEIIRILRKVQLDRELAEAALQNIQNWLTNGAASVTANQAQQQLRLAAIERERAALLDLLVDGTLQDRELYRRKEAGLVEERNHIAVGMERGKGDLRHIESQAQGLLAYASSAAAEFVMAEPDRKRAIAAALGFGWELRDKRVSLVIDPALQRIVRFAHQKSPVIEPGFAGSTSLNTPRFDTSIPSGGTNPSLIPPEPELLRLLRESTFPDLYSLPSPSSSG